MATDRRSSSTLDDAEQALIVPPFVADAPAPVRWFLEATYCPLLSADDTSRERLLKSFVFATVPLQATVLSNMTLALVTGSLHGPPPAAYLVEAAGMLIMAVAWGAIYLHVRLTRRVSEASADLVNVVMWIGLLLLLTTNSDVPHAYSMICGMNFMLIALTPRTPLFVCMFVFIYFLACYNTTVATDCEPAASHATPSNGTSTSLPLLMVPDPVRRGIEVRLFFSGIYILPILGVAIGLVLRMMSADQMSRQADASARLAAVIARSLAQYDTKAAAFALETAVEAGDASPELLEHFATLIANLNAYRPHLPNWVVASTGGSSAGDADDEDSDMASIVIDDDGGDGDDCSAGNRSGRSDSHRSDSQTSQVSSPTPRDRSARGSAPHLHHRGATVTTAVVCLAVVDVGFPQQIEPELQHALVDRVHELAARALGAVHSFVGDRVLVSWNAASRVANPQAKAARFLVQLATCVGDDGAPPFGKSTVLSGAAVSGKAAVLVAGLGDQRAPTVHMIKSDTLRRLDALRAEAQVQGAVLLCDEPTKREAEHAVRLSLQACVLLNDEPPSPSSPEIRNASTPPARRRALGYALLGILDDTANDEWMYVLEAATRGQHQQHPEDQPGVPAVTDADQLASLRAQNDAVDREIHRWARPRSHEETTTRSPSNPHTPGSSPSTTALVASATDVMSMTGAAGRVGHLVRSLQRCAAVEQAH